MSNALYSKGKEKFAGPATGQINWTNDTIKAIALKSTYTPNLATHEFVSDVVAHDNGRTAALTGKTITNGTLDAADTSVTMTAASSTPYVAVFKDTGSDATSPLIALIDTAGGLPVTPAAGGQYTIQWNAGGIATL